MNKETSKQKTSKKKSTVSVEAELKADIYNQEGKAVGTIPLPGSVFAVPWNADLMHQVIIGFQANKRTPVAHTKDRGEVRGGGRKPWRQKGTGRARHGSIRSPLWRGGGVTFGPRNEKDYGKKINRKMRAKALCIALSKKLRDNELLFIDTLTLGSPKTKDAKRIAEALSGIKGFGALLSKKRNSALIAIQEKDTAIEKSFSNFGNIHIDEVRNLNALDILGYKYVIITKPHEAVAFLTGKLNASKMKKMRTEKEVSAKK
ncbi:50S ribosomal protein L4 [Candidatus Kaiserbacteria bacterium]|nr:50S ribosomal protein L4 [Candidatus Kaiserbacteria bacterium]